ncbi:flagellar biosynthesis anti-sigma factor FlgM [Azonexus sp.]|uniref:flagellar biosynthesis anti-sigma factor FlgM n=1 Tax=Azonexus sp. TaxID=1872668 RepID=UPI0027B8AE69|nr:flagellar biosynthesis anti-sigma factor FlgM [Azonexus sp.]
MKIDSTAFTATSLRTPPTAQKPAEATARTPESAKLSGTSTPSAQGIENPPVNTSRIQEIKTAISQGHFKINPEAIADGLIQTARDLVNSQRKA